MMEQVILVDEKDTQIGCEEKINAHKTAKLHRAISIFIYDSKGKMLLQQRALDKYHSGGLWSNTCCSHPRPGEKTEDVAHRRLLEEMGFDCILQKAFYFIYKSELSNGLTEYEFDHVFIGKYDGRAIPNPHEVENFKWIDLECLKKEMREKPDQFTTWFKIAFKEILKNNKTI